MFQRNLIIAVIFLNSTTTFAQNFSLNWDKTYGGNSRDWNCSMVQGASSEIFLIGDSETDIDGDKSAGLCNNQLNQSDIWLIKADTSGSIIWQRDFGGEADERNPRLILLNNPAGEMIFSCYSSSNVACDKSEPNRDTIPQISADYWIVLLDSNGVIIWEKTIGGDNYDDYTHIAQLSTGEFLVCGESNSPVGYDKSVPNYSISNDYWAVKLDETGNIIADYIFGGVSGEFLTSVIADDHGGFLLAGSTNSDPSGDVSQPSQGNLDFWMIKVDSLGNKEWDQRFGGIGPDQCNHAIRTNDNGYLLCGFTVSPQGGDVSEPPKGFQDYWVVKTDSTGNKEWDKRYGGTAGSFGTHAAAETGEGFWISGYSNSSNVLDVTEPSYGASDFWILNIDSVGNKLFDKRFGGSNNEFNTSLFILNDTTFMAFGFSDSGSSAVKNAMSKGLSDYWLVKFSYNPVSTGVEFSDAENHFINLYPNPTKGEIFISIPSPGWKPEYMQIVDLTGKIVAIENLSEVQFKNGFYKDLSGLDKGFYLIQFKNKTSDPIVKKLIIN